MLIIKLQKKLSWCLIDWQLSIPNVNAHAYSYPLPPSWQWGLTQLGFKQHRGSHCSSQCSQNL